MHVSPEQFFQQTFSKVSSSVIFNSKSSSARTFQNFYQAVLLRASAHQNASKKLLEIPLRKNTACTVSFFLFLIFAEFLFCSHIHKHAIEDFSAEHIYIPLHSRICVTALSLGRISLMTIKIRKKKKIPPAQSDLVTVLSLSKTIFVTIKMRKYYKMPPAQSDVVATISQRIVMEIRILFSQS